jgi:hypothetical protein
MTAAAPSGVVTFLFTDVEGSTSRWEKDANAMQAALAAHDEVLRSAIEVHGGFLFKHTGDGVCAAFASPRSAVDAAVAAQRALELPVRMGLPTGEAELRGGDYFGAVLNRAARVMAAGHGGQILLAESTAGLQRGLTIAQDSGNRQAESILAGVLSRWVAAHGDPADAFDYMTLAIRRYYDSGNVALLRSPLTALAAYLDRLGHHEPAASISGFAATLFIRTVRPEITTAITHLREVLGDERYEALARAGETMTNAAMATYALDQIDQARAELNAVSK